MDGLTQAEKQRFVSLRAEIAELRQADTASTDVSLHRRRYSRIRDLLHLFEDVVDRLNKRGKDLGGEDGEALKLAVGAAMLALGGQPEPSSSSVRHYDPQLDGPFLGVSDEGSAADRIRQAAFASPKAAVLKSVPAIRIGVACDAERLGAVGETAVGPDEYRQIRLECMGSILTSTNVGTRLNLKFYKTRPIVRISSQEKNEASKTIGMIRREMAPFMHTPDNIPRPVTVLLAFDKSVGPTRRPAILKEVLRDLYDGVSCDRAFHRVGLLVKAGPSTAGRRTVERHLELAQDAGIEELAVDGALRSEARDKITLPSLLSYFTPENVEMILDKASSLGVGVTPKNLLDIQTVARTAWTGLHAARAMGLELGKYGTFPLTIEESAAMAGLIQPWFSSWTAAPAYYVDLPTTYKTRVFTVDHPYDGIRIWLDLVASHGVPVVLIDTADKSLGRRLLKSGPDDAIGILTLAEVSRLDRHAAGKGVRALWAGGLTADQAYELGAREVFGIYVTTSASAVIPVTAAYRDDPALAALKEPTFEGVSLVKLLLESGFLNSRCKAYGVSRLASQIARHASLLLDSIRSGSSEEKASDLQAQLSELVRDAWQIHYGRITAKGGSET